MNEETIEFVGKMPPDKRRVFDVLHDVQRYACHIRRLASCAEEAATEPTDNEADSVGKLLALCESIQMMADKIDETAETAWKEGL